MANPFLFADTVQKIGDTILRLADARNDPLCLRDLQALACVNRKCRQMFSGHPHLVTARRIFANFKVELHQKSKFDSGNLVQRKCPFKRGASDDDDPCACTRMRRSDCVCACHAQCEHCGEARYFRTCVVANNVILHQQCANFQRFKYALYTLGNVPVALCFLAMGQVYMPIKDVLDEELLVRNGHLDAIKLLVDGGMAKLPIDFDQYGPVGTAALYPLERLDAAITFIRQTARYKETDIGYIKSANRHVIVASRVRTLTPEKLDVLLTHFPTMFSRRRALEKLAVHVLERVRGEIAFQKMTRESKWHAERMLKWISARANHVEHPFADGLDLIVSMAFFISPSGMSGHEAALVQNRKIDAAFLVYIFKFVQSMADTRVRSHEQRWNDWTEIEDFEITAAGILDMPDVVRADDHVRDERIRKRARQFLYNSGNVGDDDFAQFERDVFDQRALLEFREFVGRCFYKKKKRTMTQ